MNAKLKKIQYLGYVTPLLALLLLFYIWATTSPITIGPSGILGVFVLLYLFWVSLFFIIIHLSFVIFKKTPLFGFFIKRRDGRPFHWQLAYYVASIVAFVPVLLLAMQSVSQLTLRDVGLVVLFAGLAVFYVVKRA